MLALVWLLYLIFGVIARSTSPLVTPILEDLRMSFVQMGVVLGSWQLAVIAVSVIAGVTIDRWGVRKSLFFGTFVIGISAVLRYFAEGFYSLLAAVAIFGIGGPLISIGIPKAVSQWFRGKERAKAVGIYTTGPWVGGMLVLSCTNGIVMPLSGNSWRMTFVFYGVVAFFISILWWFTARETHGTEKEKTFKTDGVLLNLLKVKNVQIVIAAGLLSFIIMHGVSSWLPKILENGGMSPKMAGLAAASPFLVSIPTVILIPRLLPAPWRGRGIALIALLAGLSGIFIVTSFVHVALGLFLYGLTGPSLLPLLILTLMETPEVGSKYMGSAGGLFFTIAQIGGFSGPFAIGALVDLTGTFMAGALFLAVVGMVIAILMLQLKSDP